VAQASTKYKVRWRLSPSSNRLSQSRTSPCIRSLRDHASTAAGGMTGCPRTAQPRRAALAHLHRLKLNPWQPAKRSESGRTNLTKFLRPLNPVSALPRKCQGLVSISSANSFTRVKRSGSLKFATALLHSRRLRGLNTSSGIQNDAALFKGEAARRQKWL
jgi:hypothetical protein